MLTLDIKSLDGSEKLTVLGETKQECLVKLVTNAEFFKVGQTYRRIRFDVVPNEALSV
jgi:hypothetical protein